MQPLQTTIIRIIHQHCSGTLGVLRSGQSPSGCNPSRWVHSGNLRSIPFPLKQQTAQVSPQRAWIQRSETSFKFLSSIACNHEHEQVEKKPLQNENDISCMIRRRNMSWFSPEVVFPRKNMRNNTSWGYASLLANRATVLNWFPILIIQAGLNWENIRSCFGGNFAVWNMSGWNVPKLYESYCLEQL